ncbi:uncharacterized protein LOC100907245 [Galendromus occidentalis]|uniref:Uncharacterized protein LOC100907245 n=1 Tax=Galendromus occidentalis TaxID=34638 RepID=A0AAJ6QW56_9ACAR|nr:uncharacterized protein LOC100907245 [Galendromus occidentalis]
MPYIRVGDRNGTTKIVAIHGTPGSLEDYRCLIAPLQKRIPKLEFVAMTLPDLNYSFRTGAFWHSAEEKKQLILELLTSLRIENVDVLIGHSAGVYPALLTALYSPIRVRSLVSLSSSGTKILRFLHPEWLFSKILLPLVRRPSTRPAVLALFDAAMVVTGFDKMSGYDACSSQQSQHATRYWDKRNAPRWFSDLERKDIPRLMIYGGRDRLVRPRDSAALTKVWGSPSPSSHFIFDGKDDNSASLKQMGDTESRCPVLVFNEGGHFAFMQFPEIVAEHIARLNKFMV